MSECFRKISKAKSNVDYETWGGCQVSNTLNTFEDNSDGRATVLIVCEIKNEYKTDNTNGKKIF